MSERDVVALMQACWQKGSTWKVWKIKFLWFDSDAKEIAVIYKAELLHRETGSRATFSSLATALQTIEAGFPAGGQDDDSNRD